MQQDKNISRYVKNVKKLFPWGHPHKKTILKELKYNLKLFLNEHPYISYTELCNLFGTPISYIDDKMSLYPPDELLKSLQFKKRKYIIIGLITSILIIALICCAIFAKHYIAEHSAVTISEEFIYDDSFIVK